MIVHIFKHQRKAKLFLWLLFTFKPKSQKSVKSSTVWRFCNVAIWIVPVSERNSHLTVYTFHIFLVMHQTHRHTHNYLYDCANCIFQIIKIFHQISLFLMRFMRCNTANTSWARCGLNGWWSRKSNSIRSISR